MASGAAKRARPDPALRRDPAGVPVTVGQYRNAAHGYEIDSDLKFGIIGNANDLADGGDPLNHLLRRIFADNLPRLRVNSPIDETTDRFFETDRQPHIVLGERLVGKLLKLGDLGLSQSFLVLLGRH